ncbi:DUF2620 family protein [Clostridium sp. Marseille-P3244]|uniref:DUF2620 family protein n=1 Tax=Clostridium sp. Marseille-P3244 TaxID=1871020 RepID=UPI0009307ADD|nr:DUF2620 family protein [Clostridium sp. Marseille-P3244]
MKIAVGGMQKNEMRDAILKACPDAEIIVTTDMGAVPMLKDGRADYYFGACESGGGSAISILIGLMGYSNCCTVCKNGGSPNRDEIQKFVDAGKICFGMTVSNIDGTVPVLMDVLMKKEAEK